MIFDIDVSGGDLLNKDYVICIANRDGIIKGFKFNTYINLPLKEIEEWLRK